jgi:hypothetical protein
MKRKILITLLFLVLPSIIFAAPYPITNPVGNSLGGGGIEGLLTTILKAITYISIPIIALAFIYSGFKFVKSQGDSTGISEAKKTFGYTILGTAIILGSNVILEVVVETTKSLGV